jgi:hypothetical protein
MEKISKETFDTEISICQKHYQKQGFCAWGKCENCGVPLLLQKLYNGQLIEEKGAVEEFKTKIFE